jgi:hypothetical protein
MKTAVEWLFEQFVKKSCITLKDIQIAKEMEKEQIIDARENGIDTVITQRLTSSEQYYKETFKSE